MIGARGRPVRFLVLVTAGWIGMRVTLLWPDEAAFERAVRVVLPVAVAENARGVSVTRTVRRAEQAATPWITRRAPTLRPVLPPVAPDRAVAPDRVRLAMLALLGFGSTERIDAPAMPPLVLPPPPSPGPGISVSLWTLARPGAATGGPVQLGGGQAGMRVRIPVTPGGAAAVAARVATPLAGPGREAALGIEWRPIAAPVAIVIERRVALDSGRDGTGLGMIAGIDRILPGGSSIEAYGQAGMVARDGIEPYADGAARLLHRVGTVRSSSIRLGIGGWGGAQRGAARLDIGPSAVATMPVAKGTIRLSIDWRQRVAGNATPGSGPAVTLGSDF